MWELFSLLNFPCLEYLTQQVFNRLGIAEHAYKSSTLRLRQEDPKCKASLYGKTLSQNKSHINPKQHLKLSFCGCY